MHALQRITAPTSEPLTLAETKTHLRVSINDDDALITSLIVAARMMAEEYTGRAFITQSWRMWIDAFPHGGDAYGEGVYETSTSLLVKRYVIIPRPPLLAVTGVASYDDEGVGTVFAAEHYFVDTASDPGRLALRTGASWPLAGRVTNGISIDFDAGYGGSADVPASIKAGMLAHIGHLYENRGDGTPSHSVLKALPDLVAGLYAPFRIHRL